MHVEATCLASHAKYVGQTCTFCNCASSNSSSWTCIRWRILSSTWAQDVILKLAEASFVPTYKIYFKHTEVQRVGLIPTFDLWFLQTLSPENLFLRPFPSKCAFIAVSGASWPPRNHTGYRLMEMMKWFGKRNARGAWSAGEKKQNGGQIPSVFTSVNLPSTRDAPDWILINNCVKNPHGILRQERSNFSWPLADAARQERGWKMLKTSMKTAKILPAWASTGDIKTRRAIPLDPFPISKSSWSVSWCLDVSCPNPWCLQKALGFVVALCGEFSLRIVQNQLCCPRGSHNQKQRNPPDCPGSHNLSPWALPYTVRETVESQLLPEQRTHSAPIAPAHHIPRSTRYVPF